MVDERKTYFIGPDDMEKELSNCLAPLGEYVEAASEPSPPVNKAEPIPRINIVSRTRPRCPGLLLTVAWLLGPLSILLTVPGRRHRVWVALSGAAVLLAAMLATSWRRLPDFVGTNDHAVLLQLGASAVVCLLWIVTWARGLLATSRVCGDLQLSRPGHRRPLMLGLAGLLIPGFGLLVTGHAWRAAVTVCVVGVTATCTLLLVNAGSWWTWHCEGAMFLFTDLQAERFLLVLFGMTMLGLLAWIVQALEGARLAAGQRFVRSINSADRLPAALLIALVVFGLAFQPTSAARHLDTFSRSLVNNGFRLIPLCSQRAASVLDPGESAYQLRVADRYDDLGQEKMALAIREKIEGSWLRYEQVRQEQLRSIMDRDPAVPVEFDDRINRVLIGTMGPLGPEAENEYDTDGEQK